MAETVKPLKEVYPMYDIGEGSYGGLRILGWQDKPVISIGKYCSFSFGVTALLGGDHRTDWTTTYPFSVLWNEAEGLHGHPASHGDIRIGHDVWVGAEAMILSGVTIGDGAVIAARAVVDRDVPAYAHAIGYPARVLKYRFDKAAIARLLGIRWWDWPRERIARALPLMLNVDVGAFLDAVEGGRL